MDGSLSAHCLLLEIILLRSVQSKVCSKYSGRSCYNNEHPPWLFTEAVKVSSVLSQSHLVHRRTGTYSIAILCRSISCAAV